MASAAVKPTRWAWTFVVALVLALTTAAAPAQAWQPEGAAYGVGELANQSVKMSDGTVLSANVYYPMDPKTGQEAAGPFPVILTQTPYGKDDGDLPGASSSSLAELAGESDYLIERGYIQVVADGRATGG